MTASTAVTHIGYYCGRFGPGFWGEPLNSLSNLAFVLGAVIAFWFWRSSPSRDPWQLLLFSLVGSIGVLISKKLQPRALLARSTLTPTLFRKRERESEQVGSLSRVLVGEGWGEGDPSTG